MAGLPYNCRCFTVTGAVAGMPNPSATGNIGGATIPPITGTIPGNPSVYSSGLAAPLIPNLAQITSSASIPAGTLIIATAAGGDGGGVTPPNIIFTTPIDTACVNNVPDVPYSIGAGGGGGGGGGDPYVIYVKRQLGLSVSTDSQNNTILNFTNPDGSFAGVVLLIKGADGQPGTFPNYGSGSSCSYGTVYPSAIPGIGGNGGYGFYTGSNGDTGIYQPVSLCPNGAVFVTNISSASGGASILGFAQVRAAYNTCDGRPPVTGGGYGTGGVGCTNAGSPPADPSHGGVSFVGAYYNPTSTVLALFGISA